MSQALFAIAGAIVGVLGTVLTALIGARHEERRIWREVFRTVCAEFASHVSELQDLSHQLRRAPADQQVQQAAEQAHTRARGSYEQLRLTSRSAATQEAARWVIHCVYYQWTSTQGGRGDFWEARKNLYNWMSRLYVEARKELGLGDGEIYQDPEGGLPIPTAEKETSPE
jgi:hypothetical protein